MPYAFFFFWKFISFLILSVHVDKVPRLQRRLSIVMITLVESHSPAIKKKKETPQYKSRSKKKSLLKKHKTHFFYGGVKKKKVCM